MKRLGLRTGTWKPCFGCKRSRVKETDLAKSICAIRGGSANWPGRILLARLSDLRVYLPINVSLDLVIAWSVRVFVEKVFLVILHIAVFVGGWRRLLSDVLNPRRR